MRRLVVLFILPAIALAQTVQVPSPDQARPGERLPWTRFRPAAQPYNVTPEEKHQIQAKIDQLAALIRELHARPVDDSLLADVEIFQSAAEWNLFFPEEFFRKDNVAAALKVLDQGLERAAQLKAGKTQWTTQKGRLIRGYRSQIDGSVQPFRLTVPDDYDGSRPFPLDIALHGRMTGTYEVGFINDFPRRGAEIPYLPGTFQIEVFGRGNNTYHWPGEADVFEAMAAVRKMYKIDADRIMLRGFSMGGAGVWHIAPHYPDLWASVEAGAGDNESHRMPALATLSPHQQSMCMIFDNMYQWMLNLYSTPFVGYVGELDGTFRKHILARQQLASEGFHFEGESVSGLRVTGVTGMTFFLALNTPHHQSPEYRVKMNALHSEHLARGRQVPDHVRFLTYTTRYNRSFWVSVEGLAKQYERGEVDATRLPGGTQYNITTKNLTGLRLRDTGHAAEVDVDGQKLNVKPASELTLEKVEGRWRQTDAPQTGLRKIHGLQGPIDDAFLTPFLVVRPTGTAWNAAAEQEADRILERFNRRYLLAYRGHIRIKDDKDVTEADLRQYNLVLFGDPGSNRWIAKLSGSLPVAWTRQAVTLGSHSFPAAEFLPAYIYPNPLNTSRYVVINSGLTADWVDWAGDFPTPQYGDFAVLSVKEDKEVPNVAYAGLFDETWKLP